MFRGAAHLGRAARPLLARARPTVPLHAPALHALHARALATAPVVENVIDLIGSTPMVRLRKLVGDAEAKVISALRT